MKKNQSFFFLLIMLLLVLGCHAPKNAKDGSDNAAAEVLYKPRHAKGFSIEGSNGVKYLRVFNPWQFASDVAFKYHLRTANDTSSNLSSCTASINVPVQRVVCMSTTHVAFIDRLGRSSTIKGMSGTKLVYSPRVQEQFEENKVKDVGYDSNLSYEQIYALHPDVVFAYGVEGEFAAVEEKLRELGIAVVYIGDYVEETPLGKAEWLVAMAAFFGMEADAVGQFERVCTSYDSIKNLAAKASILPKVMLNSPFKDVWYVPGGKGFMAQFIEDAAGKYLLSDMAQRESQPMSIEKAYTLAQDADYWLIADLSHSLNDLAQADHRLASIPAFKAHKVFNNNARSSAFGGNDIWESGIVQPQVILSDIIKILHPELLPEHELYYYKQLK